MNGLKTKSRKTKRNTRQGEVVVSGLHRRLAAIGKTPSWLAREFKVSPAAVHRWIAGTKKPKKARIPRLAELLGYETPMQLTYDLWPDRRVN
jgi:plasmid maintenance system antidote protein VapI